MIRNRRIKQSAFTSEAQSAKEKEEEELVPTTTMIDNAIEDNLNLAIISINGETDQLKISSVVKRMHSRDVAIVRDFLNLDAPGIDLEIKVACPHCEEEFTLDLPISENFFRPKESPAMRKGV
jgi:hypothetical protein